MRGLRRGLRRGPLDRRGRHRQRRAAARDHRRRCSPGSPRARTTRPPMKMIAALRNQFGGHAVRRRRSHSAPHEPRPTRTARKVGERPCTSRICRCADFRSYAGRRGRARAGRHRVRRAATGRARPTWSRPSATSPRSAATGSPPTRRWCGMGADRAVVRAAVVRTSGEQLVEIEINPGRANRARINRSPRATAARAARHRAHGAVRARGPGPGARATRPSGGASSTSCSSPARPAAGRACGPTTTGCSSSATPC